MVAPDPMDHKEKARLRSAAFRAQRIYPGPVGELLARELDIWEEFGYRFGGTKFMSRLVQHLLTTPTEAEKAAALTASETAIVTNYA